MTSYFDLLSHVPPLKSRNSVPYETEQRTRSALYKRRHHRAGTDLNGNPTSYRNQIKDLQALLAKKDERIAELESENDHLVSQLHAENRSTLGDDQVEKYLQSLGDSDSSLFTPREENITVILQCTDSQNNFREEQAQTYIWSTFSQLIDKIADHLHVQSHNIQLHLNAPEQVICVSRDEHREQTLASLNVKHHSIFDVNLLCPFSVDDDDSTTMKSDKETKWKDALVSALCRLDVLHLDNNDLHDIPSLSLTLSLSLSSLTAQPKTTRDLLLESSFEEVIRQTCQVLSNQQQQIEDLQPGGNHYERNVSHLKMERDVSDEDLTVLPRQVTQTVLFKGTASRPCLLRETTRTDVIQLDRQDSTPRLREVDLKSPSLEHSSRPGFHF